MSKGKVVLGRYLAFTLSSVPKDKTFGYLAYWQNCQLRSRSPDKWKLAKYRSRGSFPMIAVTRVENHCVCAWLAWGFGNSIR